MTARSDFTLIGSYWPDSRERQLNLLAFLSHWEGHVDIKMMMSNQPRTHSINQTLQAVTTPYVGVADVDGLLDIEVLDQVRNAFEDGADVVYPYSRIREGGTFWNPTYVFGILVFFKTEAYRRMGGENEAFESWGWEDFERYYRALNHGLTVVRLDNEIEHLSHPHNRADPRMRRRNYRLMIDEMEKYERSRALY